MSNVAVLIGFKMCGKSTFGQMLAYISDRRFVDIDRLIEDAHQRGGGVHRNAFEIYIHDGEQAFAELEQQCVAELVGITDAVVATAGSTTLDAQNVSLLRQTGKLLLIDTPIQIIRQRWLSGRLPAFLDAADPEASFNRLYQSREPLYRRAADACVSIAGMSDGEVIESLLEAEGWCGQRIKFVKDSGHI